MNRARSSALTRTDRWNRTTGSSPASTILLTVHGDTASTSATSW